MKPAFDAARLATELRGTAHDLRLCLAELIAEDRSLLADLLRQFPTRIEWLADEIAERPVHLFLFVKVRENWSDDPERYRQMGLELPKE